MLLAAYLALALLAGVFIGRRLRAAETRNQIMDLKNGVGYRRVGSTLNYYHVVELAPLNDTNAASGWFRCSDPLPPSSKEYLRAEVVKKGKKERVVLSPTMVKKAPTRAPLPIKA